MSIASEISRLQSDSSAIASAIAAKGVTVPSGSGFDDYAALIASIPSAQNTLVLYDYLIFDGVAEVATNISIPTNGSVTAWGVGYEFLRGSQNIFSAIDANGRIDYLIGGGTTTARRQYVVYYNSSSYLKTQNLDWTYANASLFITASGFGFGNWYASYNKGSASPISGLKIGGGNAASNFTGRIGVVRIYGSDTSSLRTYDDFEEYTPIATFIPCLYNGNAGMWHNEGHTFFGNSSNSGGLGVSNK